MKRRATSQGPRTAAEHAQMPKYTIGVVSQLLGLPPQVLRRYEEAGLLEPARQSGKNRLYSDQDVAMLEEIAQLSEQGVNAAGIRHIIQIRQEVLILQQEVKEVRATLLRVEEEHRIFQLTFQQSDKKKLE